MQIQSESWKLTLEDHREQELLLLRVFETAFDGSPQAPAFSGHSADVSAFGPL